MSRCILIIVWSVKRPLVFIYMVCLLSSWSIHCSASREHTIGWSCLFSLIDEKCPCHNIFPEDIPREVNLPSIYFFIILLQKLINCLIHTDYIGRFYESCMQLLRTDTTLPNIFFFTVQRTWLLSPRSRSLLFCYLYLKIFYKIWTLNFIWYSYLRKPASEF